MERSTVIFVVFEKSQGDYPTNKLLVGILFKPFFSQVVRFFWPVSFFFSDVSANSFVVFHLILGTCISVSVVPCAYHFRPHDHDVLN